MDEIKPINKLPCINTTFNVQSFKEQDTNVGKFTTNLNMKDFHVSYIYENGKSVEQVYMPQPLTLTELIHGLEVKGIFIDKDNYCICIKDKRYDAIKQSTETISVENGEIIVCEIKNIKQIKFITPPITENVNNSEIENCATTKTGYVDIYDSLMNVSYRVKISKRKEKLTKPINIFSNNGTTITCTKDKYANSSCSYFVNAGNLEGKLGGGTSGALNEMFPQLQKDIDTKLYNLKLKRFIDGYVSVFGPYQRNKQQQFVISIQMNGSNLTYERVKYYYDSLCDYINNNIPPYSSIHSCLLCEIGRAHV